MISVFARPSLNDSDLLCIWPSVLDSGSGHWTEYVAYIEYLSVATHFSSLSIVEPLILSSHEATGNPIGTLTNCHWIENGTGGCCDTILFGCHVQWAQLPEVQLAHLPLLSCWTLLPASACGTAFAGYTLLPPYCPKICSKISHLRLMLGCDEAYPDLVLEETVLCLYLDVTEYTCAAGSSPGAAYCCPPVIVAIQLACPQGITSGGLVSAIGAISYPASLLLEVLAVSNMVNQFI
ncbi:hypothetical protein B0H14DRAFT_2649151 [Mycena olivaceomarginata]|nr:hypothetical protein B0H14DRAFT_2649151 [Mycena olivaceomarginata]